MKINPAGMDFRDLHHLLAGAVVPLHAWAQRGAGIVRDSASATPVPGAVVSALESARHRDEPAE